MDKLPNRIGLIAFFVFFVVLVLLGVSDIRGLKMLRSQELSSQVQTEDSEMQFEAEQEDFYDDYVPVDLEAVKKEFEKAAREGDAEAQFQLGIAYFEGGSYEDRDWDESEKWLKKAGEQGHNEALVELGRIFYTRCCCGWSEEELVEPVKWWSKVAKKGYPEAQFRLAHMYYHSHAQELHVPLAVKWFCKAAEQGHSQAQYYMGEIYEDGTTVKKDIEEACFWYLLSEVNDPQRDLTYMTRFSKKLTKAQQERVMARAKKWLEEHKEK